MLEQQNMQLTEQIQDAQQTKLGLQEGNRQMQNELRSIKADN